jgi:hypothetical protein
MNPNDFSLSSIPLIVADDLGYAGLGVFCNYIRNFPAL